MKSSYKDGKLNGEYLEYDEQGRLRGKGFYHIGKLEGQYFKYDKKEKIEN